MQAGPAQCLSLAIAARCPGSESTRLCEQNSQNGAINIDLAADAANTFRVATCRIAEERGEALHSPDECARAFHFVPRSFPTLRTWHNAGCYISNKIRAIYWLRERRDIAQNADG